MSEVTDSNTPLILGETRQLIAFATRAENIDLSATLAGQARRTLDILTPDLETPVYGDTRFVEAVRTLALRSRHTRIRVLVQDSTYAVKHGHRLIETARRLTSSIFLHNTPADYEPSDEGFLLADATGYVHKRFASRYEGEAHFNDRLRARELTKLFDELWEKSEPDQELRRLHL